MPNYRRHVFVCINERSADNPRGCCKGKGAVAVRAKLKSELALRGLKSHVRANNAGCLDQCEYGVVMVVYPEQVWYGGVTVDDVNEIIERHVIGGEYVKRLMIENQPHLADATASRPLFAASDEVPDGVDLAPKSGDAD